MAEKPKSKTKPARKSGSPTVKALPEPGKAGRKTKRTPEVENLLFEALQLGCTRRAACAVANISEDSLANWMRDCSDFSESITRAENMAEAGHIKVMQLAAAAGDWRASESWLKRMRRADFGDVVKTEHSGTVASVNLSKDEYLEQVKNDPNSAIRDYRAKTKHD